MLQKFEQNNKLIYSLAIPGNRAVKSIRIIDYDTRFLLYNIRNNPYMQFAIENFPSS